MKWEYLRAQLLDSGTDRDDEVFQQFLNDRGNEGWELVTVLAKPVEGPAGLGRGDLHQLYFKRPQR